MRACCLAHARARRYPASDDAAANMRNLALLLSDVEFECGSSLALAAMMLRTPKAGAGRAPAPPPSAHGYRFTHNATWAGPCDLTDPAEYGVPHTAELSFVFQQVTAALRRVFCSRVGGSTPVSPPVSAARFSFSPAAACVPFREAERALRLRARRACLGHPHRCAMDGVRERPGVRRRLARVCKQHGAGACTSPSSQWCPVREAHHARIGMPCSHCAHSGQVLDMPATSAGPFRTETSPRVAACALWHELWADSESET
jgi:hypothetical protein